MIGGGVDLRQLRYFNAVAQHGKVSRAAASLNVAQPAISRHIQQLERELGVTLLQRHARGVSLTEAGTKLLSHSTFLLRHFEQARLDVLASATEPVGQISISVLPTVAEILGVPLADRIFHEYPKVSLILREGFSGPCLDWLMAGTVDFAVLYNIERRLGLDTLPLLREPICLVGSKQLPRPDLNRFPISRLEGFDLILPSPFNGLRRLIDAACSQRGIRIEPRLVVDSLGALKSLVHRGTAYTLMPISAVASDVKEDRLWSIPLTDPELMRTLELARIAERPLSTAGQRLRATVRNEVEHLARQGAWPPEITVPDLDP